jgi:hypothetical protein
MVIKSQCEVSFVMWSVACWFKYDFHQSHWKLLLDYLIHGSSGCVRVSGVYYPRVDPKGTLVKFLVIKK